MPQPAERRKARPLPHLQPSFTPSPPLMYRGPLCFGTWAHRFSIFHLFHLKCTFQKICRCRANLSRKDRVSHVPMDEPTLAPSILSPCGEPSGMCVCQDSGTLFEETSFDLELKQQVSTSWSALVLVLTVCHKVHWSLNLDQCSTFQSLHAQV